MPAIPEAPVVGGEVPSWGPASSWPADGYAAGQRLPMAMGASRVAPEIHELSRQLRRHAALAEQLGHLLYIERTMQWPGARFDDIPQAVLLRAVWEMRLLARRCDPAAGARLLDFLEGRLQARARQAPQPRSPLPRA